MAFVNMCIFTKEEYHRFSNQHYLIDFKFTPDRTYYMSIDQSSSSTGVYVTDSNYSFHALMEIQRESPDKDTFYQELRGFLLKIFPDCELGALFYEELPPMKYQSSGRVLQELQGIIRGWVANPEYKFFHSVPKENFDKIHPGTWKKHIVDKKKSKHRHKDKYLIASDICDMLPELRPFIAMSRSKDFDAFDAVGIFHGYLKEHFSDGKRKIGGSNNTRADVMLFYQYLTVEQLQTPGYANRSYQAEIANLGIKGLKLEMDSPFLTNCLKAASRYPFSFTFVEDRRLKIALCWQFGWKYDDSKVVLCHILRKKDISTGGHLKNLKSWYNYEEINQ